MKFDWLNIAVGVVCFVIVGLLVGWLAPMLGLALPSFIWSAITAVIAILIWFSIMPRIKR